MTVDVAGPLIVDAANVVGSVPDGWWRDRAGAATRLRDRLAAAVAAGVVPAGVEVILVVEGAARAVPGVAAVRVVAASGSGDDAIVALVGAGPGTPPGTVVTADRGLRDRVTALGAAVLGPAALLAWLRAGDGAADRAADGAGDGAGER